MNNAEQNYFFGKIFGIPSLIPDIRKIKERVGLTKKGVPEVTGSTDSQKLASLISGLEELGLIKVE